MIKSIPFRRELSIGLEQARLLPAQPLARSAPVKRLPAGTKRPFYRVLYEAPAGAHAYALLRYLYGAELLFDPTLKEPRALRSSPVRVPGIVLHNDLDADPRMFIGMRNPALAQRVLHEKYSDKCEEHALLTRCAPHLAVETLRADVLWRELGVAPHPSALARFQEHLRARFGKYVLKARAGFGSDGYLPTHEHDFAELWRAHATEVVPMRAKIFAETRDADERVRRLYEELEAPESLVIEQLLARPSEVIAQQFIEHGDEVRVHVVEGRVLAGGTTRRWWSRGAALDPVIAARAEAAVLELLSYAASLRKLSCAPDILVEKSGGLKLIDLNPGISSGMYYPENDLFITNALSAHFTGEETDYLRDLRRLRQAPLDEKNEHARAMIARVGAFVRENESYGFFDQIVDAYLADVERDPSRARVRMAVTHFEELEGFDPSERRRALKFMERVGRGRG